MTATCVVLAAKVLLDRRRNRTGTVNDRRNNNDPADFFNVRRG